MSEEPRSLWAKINYIQNISNWLKPYQSVLLTVTLMLMYIVLGATIFFRFGVPLEMHRKMWAAGEISLAIEEHTHQIWRSLNQSSNNFSVEWLIRKELSQLGDKIITFTGSVMYRNETDFDWGMSEAAVHSLCLMTAIGMTKLQCQQSCLK